MRGHTIDESEASRSSADMVIFGTTRSINAWTEYLEAAMVLRKTAAELRKDHARKVSVPSLPEPSVRPTQLALREFNKALTNLSRSMREDLTDLEFDS